MQYLHDDKKIFHRDLKHDNILMGFLIGDPYNEHERQPTIKVSDFTTAGEIDSDEEDSVESVRAGTTIFMAPEVFTKDHYNAKPLDVWAFGMTVYVYMFNKFPIKFETELEIENQIKDGDQMR